MNVRKGGSIMGNLFNQFSDIIVKPLLRSPFHAIASSRALMIIHGDEKPSTTSVDYRRDGNWIIMLVRKQRNWWKYLADGTPITLRLHSQDIDAVAEIMSVDKGVKFETLKWMYPWMPVQQITDLLSEVMIVRIHVPQAVAVPA